MEQGDQLAALVVDAHVVVAGAAFAADFAGVSGGTSSRSAGASSRCCNPAPRWLRQ
jgi:hypothetical protein